MVENKPIQKVIRSKDSSLYSEDYVPSSYKTTPLDTSTIHICVITAKTQLAIEVEMLVRSVILHARRSEVFFHFVASEGAEKTLPRIFNNITHAFVKVRYEIVKVEYLVGYLGGRFKQRFSKPTLFLHRWSLIYGTGKIFMYDLLPHVNKCIVIDTDTVFGVDPAFLWSDVQSRLQTPVALAVTWFPEYGKFNSGVMLQDLEHLRQIQFINLITGGPDGGCRLSANNNTIYCTSEQELLNQVMDSHPELFYLLDISWNIDACNDYRGLEFDSFEDKRKNLFYGITHFNCISPALNHVYEHDARHVSQMALRDYILYLKQLDFRKVGEKQVIRDG